MKKTKLLKNALILAGAIGGLCLAIGAANITNVNTGASSDDHSGDPLRTAFTKINTNFWWLTNNMSTLLDYAAGTSQGTLLYRGASGWTALAPGTFGQFLKTLGPSANPAWAAIPGGGDALTGNPLSQFAPTTSSQLAGVISDETGSGQAVFAISPTFTTPTLGAATATTLNKVTITTPASGATLTIADGKTVTHSKTMTFTSAGDSGVLTFPNATATIPATSDNLSVFAATTSAQLAGVISDETGSGPLVFSTSPTFTTPVLGVASATTVNKVTLTAPATGSTITIADGRTLTVSKTMTLTSAGDGGVLTFPNATATIPATSDNLSVFAATTSAQLAGVLSDETGSGAAVFATSPTLTTPNIGAATATSLTDSGLTASRVVLTDGSKVLASAAASGAVPIDADGSATTAAQIVGRFTGTPDGTKFLRDDGTLVTPAGGGISIDFESTQFVTNTTGVKLTLKSAAQETNVINSGIVTLTDAATVATDASLGTTFKVTLAGNRTLGNPTNAKDGERFTWEVIQDGTGGRTLAMDTKFAFGTDITGITLTTTASKRDFITAFYDLTADKFYVVGFVRGY